MQKGDKINRWTILEGPFSKNRRTYYQCQCDCGYIQLVRSDNLKSGHSQSHRGCKLPKIDLDNNNYIEKQWKERLTFEETLNSLRIKNAKYLGTIFGKWKLISVDHISKFGEVFYRCKNIITNESKISRAKELVYSGNEPPEIFQTRDNIISIEECNLKSSNHQSVGEAAVQQWLINNHIDYIYQHFFPDLKDKRLLRFDFYIKNTNVLIEFQGKQHYYFIPFSKDYTEDDYLAGLKRDEMKREYCKQHNYKEIEIPYWDIDKIDKYLSFLKG